MALFKGTQVTNKQPLINSDGFEPVVMCGDFVLPAGMASGDIVELVGLPAGYVPVDVLVDCEALGTTMTADVGFLSGNYDDTGARTMTADFMTGKAMGAAGIFRMDVAAGARVAPTTNDRSVGIKFTTIATPTTGKKVRLNLSYRPQIEAV